MKFDLPNNRTLEMHQDNHGGDSRSWDNLSKMIFVGNYKHLGDKHDVSFDGNYNSRQEFIEEGERELKKQIKNIVVCKAVHLYSHSGETISTSFGYPYNCRWDSGTIGFVIVTKEAIRENWGVKNVTQKLIDHAEELADGEVNTLDQEIRGEVYSFTIKDKDGEVEDSCSGFYGDDIKENGILDNISEEDRNFIEKSLVVSN